MYRSKQTEGYSLVEVLVAIAILLLSLVGPMTIAAKGIQSSSYVAEQTTAIFLAQEGIGAFTAARNDSTIRAFGNGNLSDSWSWVIDGAMIDGSCYDPTGCNIEYIDDDPLATAKACGANGSGCELYFDDTNSADRARYTMDTGNTPTEYTRVIVVKTIAGGLEIESTVYWNTRLFSTQEQSVTLTASLFNLYE